MKYGEVYIITKEFEFDNAFETSHVIEKVIEVSKADFRGDKKSCDVREEEKILCSITTGDVEMRY